MPLRGQGGHDPVGGIEDHVGGRKGDLEGQSRVTQADDAGHEGDGADEGDDPVSGVAKVVLAFFGMPVELSCDIFVAFDNQKGAAGVCDYDVVFWHLSALFPSHEGEIPTAPEADEAREEGQQYGSEESEAIVSSYGQSQEGGGHGCPQ